MHGPYGAELRPDRGHVDDPENHMKHFKILLDSTARMQHERHPTEMEHVLTENKLHV